MEDFKPGCPSDDAFTDFPCQVTSAVTEFRVTDGTRVFFKYYTRLQNLMVI